MTNQPIYQPTASQFVRVTLNITFKSANLTSLLVYLNGSLLPTRLQISLHCRHFSTRRKTVGIWWLINAMPLLPSFDSANYEKINLSSFVVVVVHWQCPQNGNKITMDTCHCFDRSVLASPSFAVLLFCRFASSRWRENKEKDHILHINSTPITNVICYEHGPKKVISDVQIDFKTINIRVLLLSSDLKQILQTV